MIVLQGLGVKVDHVAFAADGRKLLAMGGHDPRATAVWRLPEGGRPTWFDHFAGVQFTPDGESLIGVTYSSGWNLEQEIGRMPLGPPPAAFVGGAPTPRWLGLLNCMKLSPRLDRLAATNLKSQVIWWSWPGFAPLAPWTMELCGRWCIGDLAFSPDGTSVAVFQHGGLTLHETATGRLRWTAEVKGSAGVGCVAWSPDGRFVAAGAGKRLRVFDVADGSQIVERTQASKHFLDAEFTSDGRFLATVSNEATVKFFDTQSWGVHAELAWKVGGLRTIAFSRDGMLAAAGGVGKKVVVWDLDL
jgi:WD40 repeat protein